MNRAGAVLIGVTGLVLSIGGMAGMQAPQTPTPPLSPPPPDSLPPSQASPSPEATPTAAPSAAGDAAAARLVERAGAYFAAAGIGAVGPGADASATERLVIATADAGHMTTWKQMNEAQRAAADAFLDGALSEEWSARVRSMIGAALVVNGERPVTLRVTRGKVEGTWTWEVIGREMSLAWTFSAERIVRAGPITLTARGGRASLLAERDTLAMNLSIEIAKRAAPMESHGQEEGAEIMRALAGVGVSGEEMKADEQEMLRELLRQTAGMMREDVVSAAREAAEGEGWRSARFVWTGPRHPSLAHGSEIRGEGYAIRLMMTPAKDDAEAYARLEWREGR